MREIIIMPVNGYVNRLQAIASCYDLSLFFTIPFKILWVEETVASASINSLFGSNFIKNYFIDFNYIISKYNYDIHNIPLFLNVNKDRKIITLVGHDKGEQFFMNELDKLVKNFAYKDFSIIIKAGGKFSVLNSHRFVENRKTFYRNIDFAYDITQFVSQRKFKLPYLGLHLRTTDRSINSPTKKQMLNYLLRLRHELNINKVFLSSDNSLVSMQYSKEISSLGFDIIKANPNVLDRANPKAGKQALIDWILLSRSIASVYHKESSFSQEAAILNIKFEKSRGFLAPYFLRIPRFIFSLSLLAKKRLIG